MATYRPLVVDAGKIKRMATTDKIDSALIDITTLEVDMVSQENSSVTDPLVIGTPVYNDAAGTVAPALADAIGTVEVLGLVKDVSIAAEASGYIQTDGILTATTGQWDTVTGETGGLVAGTIYYLDPDTAGMLTLTAPTDDGDFVVRIGKAVSTVGLEISITQPIEL